MAKMWEKFIGLFNRENPVRGGLVTSPETSQAAMDQAALGSQPGAPGSVSLNVATHPLRTQETGSVGQTRQTSPDKQLEDPAFTTLGVLGAVRKLPGLNPGDRLEIERALEAMERRNPGGRAPTGDELAAAVKAGRSIPRASTDNRPGDPALTTQGVLGAVRKLPGLNPGDRSEIEGALEAMERRNPGGRAPTGDELAAAMQDQREKSMQTGRQRSTAAASSSTLTATSARPAASRRSNSLTSTDGSENLRGLDARPRPNLADGHGL